jgi:peptidoglycan biosynthesis protein MviN/MurJ (putative lipid II flippase)
VPALAVAYAIRSPERATFLTLVTAVAATPVVAAMASRVSGECVARGAPVVPIAVGAMRSLMPAVLLLAWSNAPLILFAAMLPVGEAARAVVLGVACRRLRQRQVEEPTGPLAAHGLVPQALSSGVTQFGPGVDRMFLSASGAGSVSSYEISDRLMYAASQFFSMTFIYRRVAVWARLPAMQPAKARQLLRSDARLLGGLVLVLTLLGALACLAALVSGLLPVDWRTGFWWGTLVMLSLPAHLFNVVGTRLLIIGRKPRYMLWIAVATAIINAILDALFYLLLGPIGIVLSTVLVRWIMAGVYLHLLRTVVPATIGQEATPH